MTQLVGGVHELKTNLIIELEVWHDPDLVRFEILHCQKGQLPSFSSMQKSQVTILTLSRTNFRLFQIQRCCR